MIKSKEGFVRLKGTREELITDLMIIFKALNDEGILQGQEDFLKYYKWSLYSKQELAEMVNDHLTEIKDKLEEMMK